jgi:hypothetical protein
LVSLLTFSVRPPALVILFIAAQFLVLFAFALIEAQGPSRFVLVFVSLTLAAISSSGLYIVAWSNTWTTGDLFFYLLALLSAGAVALLFTAARWLPYPRQRRFARGAPEARAF